MNLNADSLHPPSRPKSGNLDEEQAAKAEVAADDEDEIDPLDAYMDAQVQPSTLVPALSIILQKMLDGPAIID